MKRKLIKKIAIGAGFLMTIAMVSTDAFSRVEDPVVASGCRYTGVDGDFCIYTNIRVDGCANHDNGSNCGYNPSEVVPIIAP